MKHILLFGAGPLPDSEHPMCNAGGLRTYQFLRALQNSHRVKVILIGDEHDHGIWKNDRTFEISRRSPHLFIKIAEIYAKQKFDAVIAVNTFPAYVASEVIDSSVPFWADLNGWIMAEIQAQSSELQHNAFIAQAWEQEKAILLRADGISTVSRAQRFATLGELASLGRLTKEVFLENFVHAIPNVPQNLLSQRNHDEKKYFRGTRVPENAFVLLQVGGFNNWLDATTMFHGTEEAMKENDHIYFVTTGGSIPNIAENTFSRFKKMVKASPYQDRFIFLGWIEPEYIPKVYEESNVGIMADILCIETETGARNRLTEMLQFGLPLITTEGSEIAHDIRKWQCGQVVESGNFVEIKNSILELEKNKELLLTYSKNAGEVCRNILVNELVCTPIRLWLEKDIPLSAHSWRVLLDSARMFSKMKAGIQYLRAKGPLQFSRKLIQKLKKH